MNITVFAHIRKDAEVIVKLREGEDGKYAIIESGDLAVFIRGREKLLELASLLERAAQEWEGEV